MAKESLYSNLVQEFYRVDGEITRLQEDHKRTAAIIDTLREYKSELSTILNRYGRYVNGHFEEGVQEEGNVDEK